MSNNYFSPNKSITGGALFVTSNSKDESIYFRVLRQVANNPNKIGNFDGSNPINIKLGQDEAADIIRAVRINGESKFYHSFKETITSGSFKFYTIPAKDNFPAKSGFGLSIKRTQDGKETEAKVGFTVGSAERLSLYLQNALARIFDYQHSQDMKEAKEYQEKKLAAPKSDKTKELESKEQITGEIENF
jgi:hypothetical protein